MNILHTSEFYHPSVGGMQEVVKQISERLVKFGHSVTVATSALPGRKSNELNGVKIVEFNIFGNAAHGIKGDIKAYQQFLLNSDFDIMVNFGTQQWVTDLVFPILDKIKAKKIFMPTGFPGMGETKYKKYYKEMPRWMSLYDMNIFLSDNFEHIDFARKNGIKDITVIHNGASLEEFTRNNDIDIRNMLGLPKDVGLILTVGSHSGIKGHAETIKIFNSANIKNAVLLLIGNIFSKRNCLKNCLRLAKKSNSNKLNKQNCKRIIVRELSRPETVSAFKQSDLFLFTSNTECSPLVLFEAMAAGLPFLTTDVGNAAEIIQWSHGGMLLPTAPKSFLTKLLIAIQGLPYAHKLLGPPKPVRADIGASTGLLEILYKNKKLARELGQNGHAAWKKDFTWDKIAKKYEELYLSLIK